MNNIKSRFSIKDLEHLSGIMAHTLRIWEKRYEVLQPKRTDSNIRWYDISDLQKLLNVATLYRNGYKISKIASFNDDKLQDEIIKVEAVQTPEKWQSDLSMAMLSFDEALFDKTYKSMVEEIGVERTFEQMLIPFLHHVGLMWQTDAIVPAHEHFMSNLIRKKLYLEAETLPKAEVNGFTNVLFLPINEIHELGLLYIHYILRKSGKPSVYLGQSVPLENIQLLEEQFDHIRFISYFTVQPNPDNVEEYTDKLKQYALYDGRHELWYLGQNSQLCEALKSKKKARHFKDVLEIKDAILAA